MGVATNTKFSKPSDVLKARLRNEGIAANGLTLVVVALGYVLFTDAGLFRFLAFLGCFLVSTPIVGILMRALFRCYFMPLMEFIDGVPTTDESNVLICILKAPWLMATAITVVWLVFVPLFVFIVESLIPGVAHPPINTIAIMICAAPAWFLTNLLRTELLFKPYVALLDASQRRGNAQSGLKLSVQKRLWVSLILLGPYWMVAFALVAWSCITTCHTLPEAQHRLSNMAIFFVSSSAIFAAVLAYYLGRIINRPLQQIVKALSSGKLDDTDPLAFDEFGVVAELIAERKRMEQAKQNFVAVVSHELRSPLMSMQGFCKLLRIGAYGPVAEVITEKAGTAERNAHRLVRLINNLLDAEKLEAGKFDCNAHETSAGIIVTRAVDSLKELASSGLIELELRVVDCPLWADEDRMVQVLVNLIGNAIKFADGKPVCISASPCGDEVEFGVKDSGKGIAVHMQEQLFERFRQLSGDEKSGTGLGLPIAKTLVELHGGTIGVTSAAGEGSYFWVKLPLSTAAVKHVDVSVLTSAG